MPQRCKMKWNLNISDSKKSYFSTQFIRSWFLGGLESPVNHPSRWWMGIVPPPQLKLWWPGHYCMLLNGIWKQLMWKLMCLHPPPPSIHTHTHTHRNKHPTCSRVFVFPSQINPQNMFFQHIQTAETMRPQTRRFYFRNLLLFPGYLEGCAFPSHYTASLTLHNFR